MIPGSLRASIVLPVPGGPDSSTFMFAYCGDEQSSFRVMLSEDIPIIPLHELLIWFTLRNYAVRHSKSVYSAKLTNFVPVTY